MRLHFYIIILLFFFQTALFGQGNWQQPVITGQSTLATNEESPLTIQLTHLTVVDNDNWFYPWGFSLTVYPGNDYTLSGNDVIPNTNYFGTLQVPVTVNDGQFDSDPFNLTITVNPVNDPPIITGQTALVTIEDTPLTINLSDLTVVDPDNTYPNGFSIAIANGTNYTASGATITPASGFVGTLNANVLVNDGQSNSAWFGVSIRVDPGNIKPRILTQATLNTALNQPITLSLSHFTVEDPDNVYPTDFTLKVGSGSNYTVSGTTITPTSNYIGDLTVPIRVNDGKSDSDPFSATIKVLNELLIIGQKAIETNEDEPIALQLTQLTVNDPANTYPTGFTVKVLPSTQYTSDGSTVTPTLNYNGNLTVSVAVSNGTTTSKPFDLHITIKPVNDAPEIVNLETQPLRYSVDNEAMAISKALQIIDVDDTEMILAEVGITPETYREGFDQLLFANTPKIRSVFDEQVGVLTLIGNATLAEYQAAIRSIQYYYNNTESPVLENKIIYIKLNDGKNVSIPYERELVMTETVVLDIPNTFTPNNDRRNDTWQIKAKRNSERYNDAVIKVYNKRGGLVYEARGFEQEWNGQANGQLLPPDTYYYTIDMNLNYMKSEFKGAVTLLH